MKTKLYTKCKVCNFKEVLESHDRSKAGPTAPPQGLFLWDVSFEGERKHI